MKYAIQAWNLQTNTWQTIEHTDDLGEAERLVWQWSHFEAAVRVIEESTGKIVEVEVPF